MGSDERGIGETDLIDVGDISTSFDEDLTREQGAPPARPVETHEHAEAEGLAIADLKDRYAAFAIDVAFLYFIYWLMLLPFRAVALGQAAGPIPASGMYGIIFHVTFLLVAFLWFTLSEFTFQASIGKLLCHLSVRKIDGSPATLLSAIVRTLLLPIDLLLAPILIPIAAMEWSAWHKRLGDMAAGTVVIRRLVRMQRQYALSIEMLSSASRRAIAFLLDLVLLAAFACGYGLLLSPEQPLLSMILVVWSPLVFIAFFTLPEWLAGTSPGKWVLGLAICHEDGSAIGLSTALVRNLWRAFDCNPLGFFTALFSIRKQRPGDTAAGSIVICVPREWRGAAALGAIVIITAAICYGGLQNRSSFMSGEFQVNFLPSIDLSGTGKDIQGIKDQNLGIKTFNFAAGSADITRKPSIFQPGEQLFMVFDVGGFGVKAGKAWIQEDLNIRYPDGSVGLKLENINDFNQELPERGLIRFENNIALPDKAMPGRYTVTITLRDKIARREIKEQRFFYITPPEGVSEVQAPPATPPASPPPPPSPASGDSGEQAPPSQPPSPAPIDKGEGSVSQQGSSPKVDVAQ
ncbi:MAG: RDD family protein [bacterium]